MSNVKRNMPKHQMSLDCYTCHQWQVT